jgi:hypothetical protein
MRNAFETKGAFFFAGFVDASRLCVKILSCSTTSRVVEQVQYLIMCGENK